MIYELQNRNMAFYCDITQGVYNDVGGERETIITFGMALAVILINYL